ncbi:MAG: hypothetical protein IPL88_15360 [Rhizobiales bacterium]|nr:hypothetical protein [Hyphomicrobiales bacterium]
MAHDLAAPPPGATLRAVTAAPADIAGRKAVRVELTDAASAGKPGVDFGDMPTFVVIPANVRDATISFDMLSRRNGKGPADARAFAGLAYRITQGGERFESVYLRPLNGRKLNPPAPRDRRAIQYFAYPDWKFDRLRQEYPDGRYEAGADIAADEWIAVRIDIDDRRLKVSVDGKDELSIDETKAEPVAGDVGLFVDIGTEAFFANLTITPR